MANTAQLVLRVPPEEKATWKSAADAAGMSLTDYVRSRCRPTEKKAAVPEVITRKAWEPVGGCFYPSNCRRLGPSCSRCKDAAAWMQARLDDADRSR
jgi:hypothetical protein